jgi:hypothetical protein
VAGLDLISFENSGSQVFTPICYFIALFLTRPVLPGLCSRPEHSTSHTPVQVSASVLIHFSARVLAVGLRGCVPAAADFSPPSVVLVGVLVLTVTFDSSKKI